LARSNDTRLDVTLVLPHPEVAAWLRDLYASLCQSGHVSLRVVLVTNGRPRVGRGTRLLRAWKWIDAKLFRRKIAAAVHSEAIVGLPAEPDADEIGSDEGDIIIWMLPNRPPAGLGSTARYGVWTIADAFDEALGFLELVNREPVTRCDLIIYGDSVRDDVVVASAFAATDDLSLARGINGVRIKSQALLLSMISRVNRGIDPHSGEVPDDASVPGFRSSPGLLQICWGLLRLYGRYLRGLATRPFYFDQWQLAYRLGGDRLNQDGLQRLAPTHGGFWADPFVAEQDGRRFIFFEEFQTETDRGHIAAMEVGPDGAMREPVDVLKSEYHLSYPFLFRYDGSLFMIPECAESGRVEAFRCTRFPDRWESHAVLLDGVHAFDPTMIENDGKWWLFTTIQHGGNSCDDELHLFYASSPFDTWVAHPLNPIQLDVRLARPAGALFREQGRLLRPAQDCSARYGSAISILEIQCMTTEDYKEIEVERISPDWAIGAHATHTVNQGSGITVYDCQTRPLKLSSSRNTR